MLTHIFKTYRDHTFFHFGTFSHLFYLFLKVSDTTFSTIPFDETVNSFTRDGQMILFHTCTAASLRYQIALEGGREGETEGEGEREREVKCRRCFQPLSLPQQWQLSPQPHILTPGLSPCDLVRGRGLCPSH